MHTEGRVSGGGGGSVEHGIMELEEMICLIFYGKKCGSKVGGKVLHRIVEADVLDIPLVSKHFRYHGQQERTNKIYMDTQIC